MSFGLVIEILVAMLLMLTIGYCYTLNRRLERLRADEQSLKGTIAELITATEIAERAVNELKHAAQRERRDAGRTRSCRRALLRRARSPGLGR